MRPGRARRAHWVVVKKSVGSCEGERIGEEKVDKPIRK